MEYKITKHCYYLQFGTKCDIFSDEFFHAIGKLPSEFYLSLGMLRMLRNKKMERHSFHRWFSRFTTITFRYTTLNLTLTQTQYLPNTIGQDIFADMIFSAIAENSNLRA